MQVMSDLFKTRLRSALNVNDMNKHPDRPLGAGGLGESLVVTATGRRSAARQEGDQAVVLLSSVAVAVGGCLAASWRRWTPSLQTGPEEKQL